jgi:hypothetical protein
MTFPPFAYGGPSVHVHAQKIGVKRTTMSFTNELRPETVSDNQNETSWKSPWLWGADMLPL